MSDPRIERLKRLLKRERAVREARKLVDARRAELRQQKSQLSAPPLSHRNGGQRARREG
jgi:hypothetical protein